MPDPDDFLNRLLKDLQKSPYIKGRCLDCFKEFYPEDDQYWGREMWGDKLCRLCRKKHGISG